MIISQDDAPKIANDILRMRSMEQSRLRRISDYMRGKHDPPYTPRGVNSEYRWIVNHSRRNFLPLVVSVISQNLHVDGYRPSGMTTVETVSVDPSITEPAWEAFETNRMISRQHGVHRSVIKHGAAYVIVLPGELSTDEEIQGTSVPVIRPVSPRRLTALYADEIDDEWPQIALEVKILNSADDPSKKQLLVSLYDENSRYTLMSKPGIIIPDSFNDLTIADVDEPNLSGQDPVSTHGLGVCPVVRFLYEIDLDGEADCSGEVEPIIPLQDQINFTTFNEMMTEQFQAFKQRWVTGMAPVDEQNREKTPFRPGVDRIFSAEDPETKFGEFSAAALEPYSGSREDGIRHMSTISQVPPYHLLGQIANLSAEALAAARDGLDRKIEELQSNLTDPWRNVFRLTALAASDKEGWNDINAKVVWRDTSAKAFAATMDGLGKAATMLGIPVEELWNRIPGATADDVNTWAMAKKRKDAEDLAKQAAIAAMQPQALPPGQSEQPSQPGKQPQQSVPARGTPPTPAGTAR